METFSALLAFREGNLPVTGEFPSQRPVTRSLGVFFDLRLNKRLLWRHCNIAFELKAATPDALVLVIWLTVAQIRPAIVLDLGRWFYVEENTWGQSHTTVINLILQIWQLSEQ